MDDNSIHDAQYDLNAIPENVPNDILEDIDDKSMRQQKKERFSQDTRFRKHLANWVMTIVPCWLLSVIVILLFKDLT